MEEAGCVFLPAAGERYGGTSIGGVGSYGCYWSASYNTSGSAYYLFLDDRYLIISGAYERGKGGSVRLVCPAQ